MTHESEHGHTAEPHGGPQNMTGLPDARDIPEYTDVEESMAPVVDNSEYTGPEVGWWEGKCLR